MKRIPVYYSLLLCLLCACGDDDTAAPGGPDAASDEATSYSLSGQVLDFGTRQALDGQAAVSTDGIFPPPRVSVRGSEFEITEIPPGSVFHVLAGASPGYHSTYAGPFEVLDEDIQGVDVPIASEDFVTSLSDAFDVPRVAGRVLIAQVVDDGGAPVEGIDGTVFQLNDASDFVGPFFLDAEMRPDARLTATSRSGYVVFFEVVPGLVSITAVADSGYTIRMPPTPVSSTAVTLVRVSAELGDGPALPTNVSFKDDVLPIFEARGCAACHAKKEIGNEVGGLSLDERDSRKIHREVTEEVSPRYGTARVDVQLPEASLILTQPSAEDPPDGHPNITFRGASDPDYQTILVWIREGAKNN